MARRTRRSAPVLADEAVTSPAALGRMKLVPMKVARLVAGKAPYNPREMTAAARAGLGVSLGEFGLVQPIVFNRRSGRVVGGHQRLDELASRGATTTDVVLVDLDDEKERALNLALNNPSIAGQFTADLGPLLASLEEPLGDMFAGLRLDTLAASLESLTPERAEEEPEIPEPPADPITKPGDLWTLGKHRLLCGDATIPRDVARVMDGKRASILFTSPPYLQAREYKSTPIDWPALMRGAFGATQLAHLAPDAQLLVNLGLIHQDGELVMYWAPWVDEMRAAGWKLFGWYVWDKITATFKANDGRPYIAHEWVFHFNRRARKTLEWVECKHAGEERSVWGQRRPDGSVAALCTPGKIKDRRPPDSVARVQRETANADASVRSHPARFPTAFAEYWLKTWSGNVYEPFCGSGSTLIAADRLMRASYCIEIDPGYCDVTVARWERLTGRKAERTAKAVTGDE